MSSQQHQPTPDQPRPEQPTEAGDGLPPGGPLTRRRFLQTASAAALGFSVMGLSGPALERAAAQTGPRTLVCLFLFGGADSFNLYVPRDHATAGQTYGDYSRVRGNFAIPASSLNPIGDGAFGLHPDLSNLAARFEQGQMAVVRNVGPLLRPTTKADYAARRSLPQDLFAHDTQRKLWQTAGPTTAGDQGWGDSIAAALGGNSTLPLAFSIDGSNRWQTGERADYTKLSGATPVRPMLGYDASLRRWIPSFAGVEDVLAQSLAAAEASSSPFDAVAAANLRTAAVATDELTQALGNDAGIDMSDVATTRLGAQLRRVALLIRNRESLGMGRQVFFVRLGNWDTHQNQQEVLPLLTRQLDQAVGSFYRNLDELGLTDSVVTFTASDFGRTLTSNGSGTDHGWGGHSFVVGGGVRGGHYGTFPSYAVQNNPDDTGDRAGNFAGRIIPTTSVGQYGATLGQWMGMTPTQASAAFPDLASFGSNTLGFL